MRKWIKFIGFICVVSVFFCFTLPLLLLPDRIRRKWCAPLTQFFCNILLKLFGMRLELKGSWPKADGPYLIVSNHLSYLDILVLYALYPSLFITSQEVRETPGLGWICLAAGCFFVERRSRGSLAQEQAAIAEMLEQGVSVTLFPEGTSSNGESVLPFKSTFFELAVQTQTTVLPLCINYRRIDGSRVGAHNRDRLCWYGEMDFIPHFLGFLSSKTMELEVNILDPITVDSDWDRKRLRDTASRCIRAPFHPLSESLASEKVSRTHPSQAPS